MTPPRPSSVVATSLLLLSAGAARAADITVTSLDCDTSLPITATSAALDCYPHDGYCMLGQDVSVKATMTLSGVSSSTAYTMLRISPDLSAITSRSSTAAQYASQIEGLTSQYATVSQYDTPQQINLCTWTSGGYGYCPSDGTYTLKATHTLPTWGDRDWFLTGEQFIAQLLLYSDADGTDLIGDCKAHLTTRVTNASKGAYLTVPSAGRVAIISAGVIALATLLVCCGCWMMDRRKIELREEDLDRRGGSFEIFEEDPITMARRRDYDYR
jgi:hypothetical protein